MGRLRRQIQIQLPPDAPSIKPHSRTELVILFVVVGSMAIAAIVLLTLTGGWNAHP